MKNPKAPQPDPVSASVAHVGVNKSMNDPMGTASRAAANLDSDKLTQSKANLVDVLSDSDRIDPDDLTNEIAADGQDDWHEGLTEVHRLNIDESRIDEVLVQDALDEDHYPTIKDIADDDAAAHSHEDK